MLFLPVIYASLVREWWLYGIDVLSVDLGLWSFVMLVCRDVRRTHRRVWRVCSSNSRPAHDDHDDGRDGGDGSEKEAQNRRGMGGEKVIEEGYPESLVRRIPWVLTLLVSLRLTGWKIGDSSHDKKQPPVRISRSAYMKRALSVAVSSYCILDAAAFYIRTDPYFTVSGMGVDEPFPSTSTETATWLVLLRMLPPRFVRCSVIAGQAYATVTSMFYIPLALMVGLNAIGIIPYEWSPHTWPAPYGPFSAVSERGLRGLWGTWWHGINRQFSATPGRWLAQALDIPTKSMTGYALLTISAFFFSGIMHMGLIPPEPQSTLMSANWMRLHIGVLFWAHIPAFAMEMAVSKLTARFMPQVLEWSGTRVLVFGWTAAWLCLTLPILAIPCRELSYWHYYSVPISPLQGLAGKGWWTW